MWAELIGKKEFGAAVLDPGYKTFIIRIISYKSSSNN